MKRFLYSLLIAAILIGIGVFMIAKPNAFLGVATILFAIYLIVDGFRSLYVFFKVRTAGVRLKWALCIKSALNIAIGIIAIAMAIKNISAVSNMIVYLIAADFFISALIDFVDYLALRGVFASSLAMEASISLVLGILFCLFPQFISNTAITILAVVVIAIGVVIMVFGINFLYVERTFKKYGIDTNGNKSTEVEFTSVDE